jgi:hypothetical protein
MQINNNPSVQNFGMAMRVKPEAVPALQKMSEDAIAKISKIGEELKDTVHCHLVIAEGGKPIVKTNFANAYMSEFKPVVKGNDSAIQIGTRWAGETNGSLKNGDKYEAYYLTPSHDFAVSFAKELEAAPTSLDQAVVMVKRLDAIGAYKAQKEAEEAARQARVNGAVDDLMSKFGVDFGV